MKQTAVEWLIEQIFNDVDLKDSILKLAINQAKEMEKEQILRAHSNGWNNGIQGNFITTQEYYNETFKSE
jgi:hypothetical protein